jgi:two-component system sensor histidine kinase CreC
VAAIADAVRNELAPVAAQRNVELFIDADPSLQVNGDPFLLQRALSNLVLNAIDFAPPESAVTVDAQPVRGRIDITVRDHGRGIPDYAADRLFEKFYSTARPGGRKGTGLGLAFVREVAQLHGGTARLANHPDGGAVATLSIPRA